MAFEIQMIKRKRFIVLYRASYSKNSTPLALRDYRLSGENMPVGTKDEWIKWVKDNHIDECMRIKGFALYGKNNEKEGLWFLN